MKKGLICLLIASASMVTGFTATFGEQAIVNKINSSKNVTNEPVNEEPDTPQKRLLNNIMSLQTFNLDGSINLHTENDFIVNIGLDVDGDLSDFENIRIKGDLDLNLNGVPLKSNLAYIENTIYFAFGNTKFSLETNNLMDFVNFLPEMGLNLSLPEGLSNLDVDSITSTISEMEYVEAPNGDFFFEVNLFDLDLKIKTDSEYTFKGIRMDPIVYEGTTIDLDFTAKEVPSEDVDLTSPAALEPIGTYKKFEPAFNIFKSLYNTFKDKEKTITIEVGVTKDEEELLSTNIDFSYDIDSLEFGVSGSIFEKERQHDFDAFFKDNTIYFGYNDLKVSINCQTIFSTIKFILNKLNIDVTEELLNVIVELLNNDDFKENLEGISNLVKGFVLEDEEFSIDLDTDEIGLGLGVITPKITISEGNLDSISIENLNILGIGLDVKLSAKAYCQKPLIEEEFTVVEPVFTILEAIAPLLEETQFRIEFDGVIGDGDIETNDVLIDGGLQFDIENQFGYGDVTITDKKEYKHNIKGDMENPDEFYFSYNDTMNGKFTSRTIDDLLEIVLEIIKEPDEHFKELFGDLIDKIMNMPIMKALNGDIGLIFDTNILNSLEITDDHMKANIALDLANLDTSLDFGIDYHATEDQAYIDGIKISNLDLDGTTIEFNAKLKSFNSELAKERLDVTDKTNFMDFSDIKVLLKLGINTSKFDYFHFTANLKLKLIVDLENIPLDIKIRNNKGDVQVAVEFGKIPVIEGFLGILNVNGNKDYNNTNGRKASLYYQDNMLYLKRVDDVDNKVLFIGKKYTVTYSRKMDIDYFLDNIADVLLTDLLGMNSEMMDQIIGDGSSIESTGSTIKYEQILSNFVYDDNYSDTQGKFDLKVNLKSLINLSIFDTADLYVYTDKLQDQLDSIELKVIIHILVNITVDLQINTQEKDQLKEENQLVEMNEWIASRAEETINTWYKYQVQN